MLVASFWLLTVFGCLFAALFGGKDGRYFAFLFFVGVVATYIAQENSDWRVTHLRLMLVDGLFFVAMIWLMLRSASYWPIWAAACQLMTVLTHVATFILRSFSDRIYEGLSTVWVIPLMLFTIIGIELDRKRTHDRAYAPGSRAA